jgi:Terpene cyclase DEP1
MVSLLVHAILGIAVIAFIVKSNPAIFRRVPAGPQLSALEIVFWVVGIASLPLCWYFNIRYVYTYAPNPMIGQPNWSEFIALGYSNWAASSQVADYTIGNVILLPLFTIIDGRRRGINRPWLFFVSSLFTSFAFAWAFYLATVERQRRHQQVEAPVESVA